jgi:hypothetical protein
MVRGRLGGIFNIVLTFSYQAYSEFLNLLYTGILLGLLDFDIYAWKL